MNSSSQAVRPEKTADFVSHHQNNNVKVVGTSSVQSNLCTPQTSSFNSCKEHSHKDSAQRTNCLNLKQRIVQLTVRAQLHLPVQTIPDISRSWFG